GGQEMNWPFVDHFSPNGHCCSDNARWYIMLGGQEMNWPFVDHFSPNGH
mgnify:CR=1